MLRIVTALTCFALSLASASASEPAMRSLTGQVIVLERMAMPEDTMLVVDVTDAQDNPVAGLRRRTDGAQTPFDFALEIPADTALVLRAGLRGPEDALWLTEPLAIAPGDQAIDVGALRAPNIPPMGQTSLLSCGTQLVEIGAMPDTLRIRLNEQVITLEPRVAASGALYADPDNPATTLHLKGDSGVLRIDGAELSECSLTRSATDITEGVWNISAIEDQAALFPSRTELVFYPDGRISASVGCNRLIGGFRRHGGILSFGRLASTMMACPDELQVQEQRFATVLPKVDGYVLNTETGRLSLTAGGETVLRARR